METIICTVLSRTGSQIFSLLIKLKVFHTMFYRLYFFCKDFETGLETIWKSLMEIKKKRKFRGSWRTGVGDEKRHQVIWRLEKCLAVKNLT